MKTIIVIILVLFLLEQLGDLLADGYRAKRIMENSRGMIYTQTTKKGNHSAK